MNLAQILAILKIRIAFFRNNGNHQKRNIITMGWSSNVKPKCAILSKI
jgi:hypothetical protein